MQLTMLIGGFLALVGGVTWDLFFPPSPLVALGFTALFGLFMLLFEVFDRDTTAPGLSRVIIGIWTVYIALCLAAAVPQLAEVSGCPCFPCDCDECSCPAQS